VRGRGRRRIERADAGKAVRGLSFRAERRSLHLPSFRAEREARSRGIAIVPIESSAKPFEMPAVQCLDSIRGLRRMPHELLPTPLDEVLTSRQPYQL
jgi:hypothetical protein